MKINVQRLLSGKSAISRFCRQGWLMSVLAILNVSAASAAKMSGTYTVCNSSCSYSTINGALTDLKSNGVSGPVVINIAKGKWSETLTVSASITGASSSNTVTFKGQGLGTVMSAAGPVVSISSASYFVFRDMTINMTSGTYGVYLSSATYNKFVRCNITSTASTGSGTSAAYLSSSNYNGFDSCIFSGADYDIYFNYGSKDVVTHSHIINFNYDGIFVLESSDNIYQSNYIDSAINGNQPNAVFSELESGGRYNDNTITGLNMGCGFYMEDPNDLSTTDSFNMVNNLVGPYYSQDGIFITTGVSSANVHALHNTIHNDGSASLGPTYPNLYLQTYSGSYTGYDIRNNELSRVGAGYSLALQFSASLISNGVVYESGNNIYNTGGTNLIYVSGTTYNSLALYEGANSGFGNADMSEVPPFISATDLRYNKTAPAPFGLNVGVHSDIDGNPRCKLFPSAGGSESYYGKGKQVDTIYGPDTAYVGSPTVFYNPSSPGSPIIFKWYVNGKYVSDSIALLTTALVAPTSTIKLVEQGCTGTDSTYKIVVVDTPANAPVTDFISNYNFIEQNQVVNFYDLSTNGPSAWHWTISPDSVFDPNLQTKVNTCLFVYGDTSSQNPQVQFLYPGQYRVCLTASNARGKGSTDCKSSYITVTTAINMCDLSNISVKSGVLYSDGGPNGVLSNNVNCSMLINPCSDTAFFVFDRFDMDCGNAFLQVLDGPNGNPINSKHAKQRSTGFTGGNVSCSSSDVPAIGDTFISTTGLIYVNETTTTPNFSPGFKAHWWGNNKVYPAPKAKIASVMPSSDSICINGMMNFYADSTTTPNLNFLWDVDGDTTDGFEASGSSISWPYFATGNYTIRLVASNCGGNDTARMTIAVFAPPAPVATFSADNTTPATNDIVFFSPTEMQCIENYLWTFTSPIPGATVSYQNGTNSSSEYPQVVFNDTGCWTVTLFESNNFGQDSDKKTANCYIHVKGTYCQPAVANQVQDLGLNEVKLNTINNATTDNRLAYNNFQSDFSTTLQSGLKYTLTLGRATNYNSVDISVWIDWYGDKSFADSGDLVYNIKNQSGTNWSVNNIEVPKFAKYGATTMRIAVNKGGLGTKVCGPDNYGDYEDYRLYLTPYTTLPVITLKGGDTVYFNEGASYSDPGFIGTSELYGNITKSVVQTWGKGGKYQPIRPGTYFSVYNLTDASGNKAIPVTRVIIEGQDTLAPNLIVGCPGNPDTVTVGVTYPFSDPGVCSDTDLVDGDVSTSLTEIGSVNTNIVGKYFLYYTSCDYSGNCVTKTRTVLVVDTVAPVITLKGPDTVFSNINTLYIDLGDTVTDNYWTNVTSTFTSNINVNVPGTYTYTYFAMDSSGNKAVPVTRYVIVKDIMPPVLTMSGPANTTIEVNSFFNDPGVTGIDNFDKAVTINLSGSFIKSFGKTYTPTRLGKFTIVYSAKDAAGNSDSVTRNINVVDNIAPVITLKGSVNVNTCRWQQYVDSGYTVTDNYSLLTGPNKITITAISNVDVSNPGVYSESYKATDSAGNTSTSAVRNVLVSEEGACNWVTSINNNKTLGDFINLYPNPNTGEFVIDMNLPKQENIIVTITNVMGEVIQKVYNGQSSGKQTVDMSTAASGVYFVNITTSGETVTKKITIAK